MASQRERSTSLRKRLTGVFGVFLISGCEAADTPVELSAALTEQPAQPLVTSVTTRVRNAAQPEQMDRRGGTRGETRAPDGPNAMLPEAAPTSPTSPGPSASETGAEDARITSFGTEIRMPFGGPFTVAAYTTTSRATRITHAIRISKTAGGRTHTTTLNDDSGFFNQTSLFTTVGLSGSCETPTTLEAQTKHTAGSILVARQFAISEEEASCGTPTETCGGEEGGPDDVTVPWWPATARGAGPRRAGRRRTTRATPPSPTTTGTTRTPAPTSTGIPRKPPGAKPRGSGAGPPSGGGCGGGGRAGHARSWALCRLAPKPIVVIPPL
jgi:hypothetical protein